MRLSVIIPTHNPQPDRLGRVLAALRGQAGLADPWEVVLVDNASQPAVAIPGANAAGAASLRLVREPRLGLSWARRRGLREAGGGICVLVDDDNVLAPDFLAATLQFFAAQPRVGALGGRCVPEFAVAPPAWAREFLPLLALRDLGDEAHISRGLRPAGAARNEYPPFAPIGAGMALRRAALERWLAAGADTPLSDRRGGELTSSGDNDIVFSVLESGWEVGYFPQLRLTHLIPAERLQPAYLARLNRGIQQSWMQVLRKHDAASEGVVHAPRVARAGRTHPLAGGLRPFRGPRAADQFGPP
jgi:glycosyltransferase involved in cell wall biosynthesis